MAVSRRAPRHKFHARPTELDGVKFPSKLEAKLYAQLVARRAEGSVLFFLRQVPFHLPGGVVYRSDFQVFWADGSCEFLDAKGVETEAFRVKLRLVEALYPVEIRLWKG